MLVGTSCHLEGAKAFIVSEETIRHSDIKKFYKRENIVDIHIWRWLTKWQKRVDI